MTPGPDPADFAEAGAEGLDLGEDAAGRRGVRQQTGEHQDGVITHGLIIGSHQVNRHHRNPVIVGRSGAAG